MTALRNLGPRGAQRLREDGIQTIGETRAIGAVAGYHRVRVRRPGVSRTLPRAPLLRAPLAGRAGRGRRSPTPAGKA
ncbi:TfoX/Sxy family DNA transformation protein, partial [Paracraurococcus ruber]